jgi:hypothetical protein
VERGKYFRTRLGQAAALRKRRLRRVRVMLEQQPQSKKIKAADAIDFQRAVLKRLEAAGQSAYRGDVFLQMDFFSSAKDPPAIYRLPKNYLDLLGKPRDDSGIDRTRLLYRDDRQVKALIVGYHLRVRGSKPGVWVTAEPFRDFLADLDLVECVSRDNFEDDGGWWRRSSTDDFREGPFHRDEYRDRDCFRELAKFERDRERVLRHLGNDAYESQRQMIRMTAHQEHLQETERLICSGVLHAYQNTPKTTEEPHDGFLNLLAFQTRNMTLGSPFTLEFHHAPHRTGDNAAFDAALRTALNNFKERYHYLFPLASTLNVTILMIPPEGGGKDLDNLTTLILPALHEIWAPPSSLAHAYNTDNIEDKSTREYWENARNELPKTLKHSITEYRAFALPRLSDDPEDGFVRLAIGGGMRPVRFREEIDEYLAKWEDAVER